MATYVVLLNLTQQGITNIKESPARIDAARQAVQAQGGKLKEFYTVMGQYDFIAICEAPNDETAAKISLALGALGNVRSQTLRAFTEEEYRQIIAALS